MCNGHAYSIKIGGKVFEIKVDKVQWFIQFYYSDANLINKKYINGTQIWPGFARPICSRLMGVS